VRSVFLIITVCFISFAGAQSKTKSKAGSFVLDGRLIGRDTGIVVLLYPGPSGQYKKDTTRLKDGTFEFKGIIAEPSFAHLIGSNRDGNYSDMYLEPGNLSITLAEDHFSDLKMEGSYTQKQSDSLYRMINAEEKDLHLLYDQYVKANFETENEDDSNLKIFFKLKSSNLKEELDNSSNELSHLIKISFIIHHPDSYVSSTELYGLMLNYLSLDVSESLYKNLTDRLKNSRAGKLCVEELNKKRKIRTGIAAIDFTANDIRGQAISLSHFKGKYVLLDFWASWCVPCRQALPELKEVYNKYHSKGLEIITISIDKNTKKWEQAVQKEKIDDWYNLITNDEIKRMFEAIHLIPAQILIDPNGIIVWSSINENTTSWKDIVKEKL